MAVEPVDRPGSARSFVLLVRELFARTFSSCFQYRVTGLAAEAAFFAILSLPPLVFGLAGTIGFIAERFDVSKVDVLKDRVLDLASQALTPDTVQEVIAPTLDDVLGSGRIDVISVGFVLALWSGSRALNVFIDTITILYGMGGKRGIVKTRALSFSLYLVALMVAIVLVPMVLAGPQLAADVLPDEFRFLKYFYWPAVLVLSVLFLTTLYHLAVPVRRKWMVGMPGAVFTLTLVGVRQLLRTVGAWILVGRHLDLRATRRADRRSPLVVRAVDRRADRRRHQRSGRADAPRAVIVGFSV